MADPLIVETAINGGMTKDANPHIPLSADVAHPVPWTQVCLTRRA